MNMNTPENSRGMAMLIQYVSNRNRNQFLQQSEKYDSALAYSKSHDYYAVAIILDSYISDGETKSQFIAKEMNGIFGNPTSSHTKAITERRTAVALKHLPGKHNQSSHGRKGPAGMASRGAYTAARAEGATHREALDKGKLASQQVREQMRAERRAEVAKRREEQSNKPVKVEQPKVEQPKIVDKTTDHYDEMDKNYDKINKSQQEAAFNEFDTVMLETSKKISNMDEQQQMELLNSPRLKSDPVTINALALYGTPAVRDEILRMIIADKTFVLSNHPVFNNVALSRFKPRTFAQWYSLEYMEHVSKNNKSMFVEDLWTEHAQGGSGVKQAQWQMIISQVGPNAGVPLTHSFFQPGIRPPQPQPRHVQMMNEEYQRTQSILAGQGVTEVLLHRGSPYSPGIPLEPWTPLLSVSQTFADMYERTKKLPVTIRTATIPVKYILSTWKIAPNWPEKYVLGKKEHMIAGQAYAHDMGLTTTKDYMAIDKKPGYGIGVSAVDYDALYDFLPKGYLSDMERTKADDSVNGTPRRYSAHAGEVIAGNLGRGADGKFVRVGSNEGATVRAAIARGVAAGGGKGKRGAKRAAVSAAQKRQQMADTGAESMDKLGFDASDWDYIAGDKPQDPNDPQFARLIEQGLMENVDGEAYPSTLGRKIAAAAGAGNVDKAKEILARDKAKRKQRQIKIDEQISSYDDVINDKTASPRARKIAARKKAVLMAKSDGGK